MSAPLAPELLREVERYQRQLPCGMTPARAARRIADTGKNLAELLEMGGGSARDLFALLIAFAVVGWQSSAPRAPAAPVIAPETSGFADDF